jgi:hypothetical protein
MSGAEPRWARGADEDVVGMDRLARPLLRVLGRMRPGALVAVHGAPGSGKDEFVRRLAWLAGPGRPRGGEVVPGLHPSVVWFDAWTGARQGHLLGGLVQALAQAAEPVGPARERARELQAPLARLHFDAAAADPAAGLQGPAADPVAELARAFAGLVDLVRGQRPGRLLLVVDGLDRIGPELRWRLIDGLALLGGADPELVSVLSVGRESAVDAVRAAAGGIPEESARRALDDLLDLAVTVPSLELRRIGSLLRDHLGANEAALRRAFGKDAVLSLTAAAAHRPLGSPRFLQRLAWRATLLAECALEARTVRDLTEAQWAWVIVSERWPEFRRHMIRGGRQRWVELHAALALMQEAPGDGWEAARRGPMAVRTGISAWLEEDLILAGYLRLHADGLARDNEGIFWLENLLLASGV